MNELLPGVPVPVPLPDPVPLPVPDPVPLPVPVGGGGSVIPSFVFSEARKAESDSKSVLDLLVKLFRKAESDNNSALMSIMRPAT